MDLPELIRHLETLWPQRFHRGLITHIHANDLTCEDGSKVHLRVLIQARPSVDETQNIYSDIPADKWKAL